jgi:hypothetical protein
LRFGVVCSQNAAERSHIFRPQTHRTIKRSQMQSMATFEPAFVTQFVDSWKISHITSAWSATRSSSLSLPLSKQDFKGVRDRYVWVPRCIPANSQNVEETSLHLERSDIRYLLRDGQPKGDLPLSLSRCSSRNLRRIRPHFNDKMCDVQPSGSRKGIRVIK